MNLKTLLQLKAISGGGGTETGYTHENASTLTFNGNQFAWMPASYADKANLFEGEDKTTTSQGVNIETHDNIVLLQGTNGGANNDIVFRQYETPIPAGRVTFTVTPHMGESVIANGKNIHCDFWYNGNETATHDKRVTVEAVKDVAKSASVTLDNHVYKIRVWIGLANSAVYNDYRLFYTLFPYDVNITDTGESVPETGTVKIALPETMPIVYTMQHKTTVKK